MLTMWVTEDEHRRLLERCDGRQLAALMAIDAGLERLRHAVLEKGTDDDR